MLVTKLPCAFSLAILVPSAWNGARSLHLICASDTTDLRRAPSCHVPQRLCLLVKCKAKFAFPLAIVIYCLAMFWATVCPMRNCGPVRTGLLLLSHAIAVLCMCGRWCCKQSRCIAYYVKEHTIRIILDSDNEDCTVCLCIYYTLHCYLRVYYYQQEKHSATQEPWVFRLQQAYSFHAYCASWLLPKV